MTELGTAPPPAASESDEQALLKRLRDGEDAAFGELFELHAAAVRRLAQSLASDRSEAEDITAETFFRVLQALRRGAGPRDYVRAYLLTVARRVSWEWHGARRDVPVTDDELTFRAGAGVDTPARTAEHTLITTAFTSLPERWRTVLWQTEVEGEQPAMVAPHFGLSANATAALARRARQGLRAAYLQAHLSVNRGPETCRAVVEKLGGFTAGSVTGAEAERIKAHLLGCPSCRATQDELRDVCSSLRAHAGVLVLAVPALAGVGKAMRRGRDGEERGVRLEGEGRAGAGLDRGGGCGEFDRRSAGVRVASGAERRVGRWCAGAGVAAAGAASAMRRSRGRGSSPGRCTGVRGPRMWRFIRVRRSIWAWPRCRICRRCIRRRPGSSRRRRRIRVGRRRAMIFRARTAAIRDRR